MAVGGTVIESAIIESAPSLQGAQQNRNLRDWNRNNHGFSQMRRIMPDDPSYL
jgi:hypothetical protein